MSSREIKDLSPRMQVLYNRLHDKVRRDTDLQKQGLTIVLTCTQRLEERGHTKINRSPSEAFEIIALRHGKVESTLDGRIIAHAGVAGLKYTDHGQFEDREC